MNKAPEAAYRYWNGVKPPRTRAEFFNAVTTPGDPSGNIATIRLYGPIDSWGGLWGVSAKDVSQALDALPDSVDQIILRINSPGGEVFEGLAILNMLRAHKARVLAVVDALAGSAASVIAAGCDETVMSPGSMMAIHKAMTFSFGNADELRQDAEVLDVLDASIMSIYQAKAGDKDWAGLMAATTWMTADDAVAQGLADRVAIIPDAGEAVTAGDDGPEVVFVPAEGDDDEPDDKVARFSTLHARFSASVLPQAPVSSEPVDPNRKDATMADKTLADGIRERLGVTDAAATDETLLAALDEALAEQVADTPTVPAGAQLIDTGVLASLQADAAAGRTALEAQNRVKREQIVNDALADGRIAPSSKQTWLDALEKDEESAAALISTLAKNKIPVAELGAQPADASGDDVMYASLFGDDTQKEA